MPESIPQALQSELIRQNRAAEKYYIEIDSDIHGTLCLVQRGEVQTGCFDWLESCSGFEDGESQVQEMLFSLAKAAERRIATEPLENHVCRIYRYRSVFTAREKLREGRVWSSGSETGIEGISSYSVIGNLAVSIDGQLPPRVFTGPGYSQIPEESQEKAIPLLIGAVDGWTPALCKAGGWGYLVTDMPAYSDPWTGTIQLANQRGTSFGSPSLATTLTANVLTETQQVWSLATSAGVTMDYGWFWAMVYDTALHFEIVRCDAVWPSGGGTPGSLRATYRGAIFPASTFVTGNAVYQIGMVLIDSEIIAYRSASSGGLTQLLRGINGEPQPHKKGCKVVEYLPTFAWIVNAKSCIAGGLSVNEICFYDSSKDQLISNPFQDIAVVRNDATIESGQRVAIVKIFSPFGSQAIGCNHAFTQDATCIENVEMDSVSVEDDDTGNWSNINNAIDDTSCDEHTDPPVLPTTYATYLAIISSEIVYGGFLRAYWGSEWSDIASAHDGNVATFALYVRRAGEVAESPSVAINLASIPTNPEQIYIVIAEAYGTWENMTYGKLDTYFNYDNMDIATEPLAGWQNRTMFADSMTLQKNLQHKDFFNSSGAYTQDAGSVQLRFDGMTRTDQDSVAGIFEFRCTFGKTSQSCLKLRNTDSVTNKSNTVGTCIEVYVSNGAWSLSWDGGWFTPDGTFVTGLWHDFIASGWYRVPIPGSPNWTVDEDWQKYIRIRPMFRDMSVYLPTLVYHVRLENCYQNYGNWQEIDSAIDGDQDSYATYNAATGGTHHGEFYRSTAIDQESVIQRVRVKIAYAHNLGTLCQVGIGAASGGGSPPADVVWHNIGAASGATVAYVDVTGDHPSGSNWDWQDFNTGGTGQDYSIYVKVQGTNGQYLKIYDIRWDIIIVSGSIDPVSTPMVVTASGCEDALGGVYTESGGLIRNPADVEQFLLIDQCGVSPDKLDLTAYVALRDHFDGLCVSGVRVAGAIIDGTPADEFLTKFRAEFGYFVSEVRGKLTPRFWPAATAASTVTLTEDDIAAGSFRAVRTGMEEVCNNPIIYYNSSYYSSDRERTVLFGLQRREIGRIRKKIKNPIDLERLPPGYQRRYRDLLRVGNMQGVDDWGNDWTWVYDLATASYRAYGNKWFEQTYYFDFVRDAETARALTAEKLRRYSMQCWRFKFLVNASKADFISGWDPVTIQHRGVPMIAGKTTPVVHTELGTINSVKVCILVIKPVGAWREVLCEVL